MNQEVIERPAQLVPTIPATGRLMRIPGATESEFRFALAQAEVIVESHIMPRDVTKEKLVVLWQEGRKYGLDLLQAAAHIFVIDQKAQADSYLLRHCIHLLHGPSAFRFVDEECDETKATCVYKQRGWEKAAKRVIKMDQVPAGLRNKDNWKNYPADMLRRFLTRRVARDAFEEVLWGLPPELHGGVLIAAPESLAEIESALALETDSVGGERANEDEVVESESDVFKQVPTPEQVDALKQRLSDIQNRGHDEPEEQKSKAPERVEDEMKHPELFEQSEQSLQFEEGLPTISEEEAKRIGLIRFILETVDQNPEIRTQANQWAHARNKDFGDLVRGSSLEELEKMATRLTKKAE